MSILPPPCTLAARANSMPLSLPCPECGAKNPLDEPFPYPGAQLKCMTCGAGLAVSYPQGVMDKLRARGKRFQGDGVKPTAGITPMGARAPLDSSPQVPDPAAYPPDAVVVPKAPPPPPPTAATEVHADRERAASTDAETAVDRTEVPTTEISWGDDVDRTVPSARSPHGALPANVGEPESAHAVALPDDHEPTSRPGGTEQDSDALTEQTGRNGLARKKKLKKLKKTKPTKKSRRGLLGCVGGFGSMGCGGLVLLAVAGLGGLAGGHWYFSKDLPTVASLEDYTPATVTSVYAKDGQLLGELYDERRYVRELDYFPEHVQNAFVAAEDATFWEHGGVNYMGIVRAAGRGILSGDGPKGTSTITQQVAKNFLLTNERTVVRKIKEALLSWRIEETYDKEHILYLYLNEIYLGSQAYGVEAASRTYFGKSADKLTHGEAALLAGLPPRPSGYSPHKSWEAARNRQNYVIKQMVEKGHLTEAEGDAALAEKIVIIPRGNTFRETAPHFTEHARRFLVDRYGEEKVLHQGLSVTTTCDLDLQLRGQAAVTKGIFEVDQRMGFRREALEEHLSSDEDIAARRQEHEHAMRKSQGYQQDAASGRTDLPATSTLVVGEVYKAVLLEVDEAWIRVAVGSHEGMIPLEWTKWGYKPNPRRSWRRRSATDLGKTYDYVQEDESTRTEAILQRGDVVLVKIEALSTVTYGEPADDDEKKVQADRKKAFKSTPAATDDLVSLRLWQVPVVEGALLAMDVHTGDVVTMVGGADFSRSQLNRAVQSRRQVGSTFKPIVYAAAIESRKFTAASMVPDAPLAKASTTGVWKPGNYGNDFLGNITLRKALAMSRNTCTVRVLASIDPDMTNDVIYEFGRRLGIGGDPLYRLPEDHVVTPSTDRLCPWVKVSETHACQDVFYDEDNDRFCRSCDLSMALGSASITVEEMVRAYSAFASGGKLIEPNYVTEVKDRNGAVLYTLERVEPPQVLEPEVAAITTWLMQNVVQGGTASKAQRLGLRSLAGKTGTTNEEKDTWFIGFTPHIVTAVWVGFDQPAPLGVSSTGGRTALPIWMDYMKHAAPKEKDDPFIMWGNVQNAMIDEATGHHVSSGGRSYPFLKGTVPESTGGSAGQVTANDVMTEL